MGEPAGRGPVSGCLQVSPLNYGPVKERQEAEIDTGRAEAAADEEQDAAEPIAGEAERDGGGEAAAGWGDEAVSSDATVPGDDTGPGDDGGPGDDRGPTDVARDASGPEEATRPARSSSPYRRAGFAVARALIVLVVAGVAYQLVVPTVHVERGRLARLVPSKPGVAAFNKTSPQAAEQNDVKTGLAAVTAAAKRSPNQTGIYSIQWVPTQTTGAGIVAFLLPNDSSASTALAQARAQQLTPISFSSNGLTRTSTFAVAGVPRSYGAVYQPSSKATGSPPGLAVTVFRYGKVVVLSDVASSQSSDQAAAEAVAAGEYSHLRQLGSGFSLSVTRRPVVPTVLWVVGAVVLAAMAALTPVIRRRRAEKRRRAYEEEMAHRVIVGRQVIVKHRR